MYTKLLEIIAVNGRCDKSTTAEIFGIIHWESTLAVYRLKESPWLTCRDINVVVWWLFDRASSSWNNVECQLDAARLFYWYILSWTCFGYIRPSSGTLDVALQHMVFCTKFVEWWWSWEPLRRSCVRCGWRLATAASAPYTRPKQRFSRPPPIQKLGAENHMLQRNIWCSWWWAYVSETCRAKNISMKLPCCIKLAFHIISSTLFLKSLCQFKKLRQTLQKSFGSQQWIVVDLGRVTKCVSKFLLRNAPEAVGFVVRRKLQVVMELIGMYGDTVPKMDARWMINLCQRWFCI